MRKAFIVVALLALLWPMRLLSADEGVELANHMSRLQYFSQKTVLAVEAANAPLAGFYLHELSEVLEKVEKIDRYDDYPIGRLAGDILRPAVDTLEQSIERKAWEQTSAHLDALLDACNACHQSTDHAFIVIQRGAENPYLQDFGSGR